MVSSPGSSNKNGVEESIFAGRNLDYLECGTALPEDPDDLDPMEHNTAPCATRGVVVYRTASYVTLALPYFGVCRALQYAAWVAQSFLVRTQGILGSTMDPATVTTPWCAMSRSS
jgi:hypothetical protein